MLVTHEPSTLDPKMIKALSTIRKSLATSEEKEALAYLERELNLALSYITELEWDTEEAAAILKQTYGPSSAWVASLDFMEDWAQECYTRLDAHRQRKLSCRVKGKAVYGLSLESQT